MIVTLVLGRGSLDHVDLQNVAGLSEEFLQVKLAGRGRQVTDKDRAAVTLTGGQESLIAVVAVESAVLLQVKRKNRVDVVGAESLGDI